MLVYEFGVRCPLYIIMPFIGSPNWFSITVNFVYLQTHDCPMLLYFTIQMGNHTNDTIWTLDSGPGCGWDYHGLERTDQNSRIQTTKLRRVAPALSQFAS